MAYPITSRYSKALEPARRAALALADWTEIPLVEIAMRMAVFITIVLLMLYLQYLGETAWNQVLLHGAGERTLRVIQDTQKMVTPGWAIAVAVVYAFFWGLPRIGFTVFFTAFFMIGFVATSLLPGADPNPIPRVPAHAAITMGADLQPDKWERQGAELAESLGGLARKAEQITRYLNDEYAKALGDYLVDPDLPRKPTTPKEKAR